MWNKWIYNAGPFQGKNKTKSYFEGWYIRVTSKNEPWNFAIIPGVSFDSSGVATAFLQFIEAEGTSHYLPYPIEEFEASSEEFSIRIGPNIFTESQIHIDLKSRGLDFTADFSLNHSDGFSKNFSTMNAMGWASQVPFLPCYHHILHMKKPASGTVKWKESDYFFNDARVYIEKDWGNSFPKSWSWLQSSHLSNTEGAFTAAASHIPFGPFKVPAGIAALELDDRRFFWSSAWGHTWKYSTGKSDGELKFSNSQHELILEITSSGTAPLIAPFNGKMDRVIQESISGTIGLTLREKRGEVIYSGTASQAGIELVA
ncbi:MAG: hypothetical protein HWE14_06560 [Flavobacteriia bacterium]|nr:hypothetical protein [Flavobacteriia bacterium]